MTNEDVFDLKFLPTSLVIAGGGPIDVEMAQAFEAFLSGPETASNRKLIRLLTRFVRV